MHVNVAAITGRALGAIADAHADGSALVGGVAAPVGFMANAAGALPGDFSEAVGNEWLPRWSGACFELLGACLTGWHEVLKIG